MGGEIICLRFYAFFGELGVRILGFIVRVFFISLVFGILLIIGNIFKDLLCVMFSFEYFIGVDLFYFYKIVLGSYCLLFVLCS